jgi:hypothetical protein
VINAAQVRLAGLEQQLREIVPTWIMAPVVAAYQSMRGVSFLVAVTFVAEVGDVRRFATPQQLMAFLGLVPSERTTGDTVRRGSITKTGNHRARRVLIKGAFGRLVRTFAVKPRAFGAPLPSKLGGYQDGGPLLKNAPAAFLGLAFRARSQFRRNPTLNPLHRPQAARSLQRYPRRARSWLAPPEHADRVKFGRPWGGAILNAD